MNRHDKQDDEDKYKENGHEPNRPVPPRDTGGKHGKPDKDNDDDDKDK